MIVKNPIAVDRVENPVWTVVNVVENDEKIIVLIVEKNGKKFDVKPIVVDNVLKEEMEIFDKLPKPVESDDTETGKF